MTFIVGTAVLMVLIYLGTGWLGIPEIYRVKATIWSIGALIALPVLWFIYALFKPAPQEESQTKTKTRKKGNINLPSGIKLGKYTDGQEELSETGITYSGIKLPMRIKYIDKKMEVTDRDIIIHAVDMGYTNTNAVKPVRFEAFCKLRRKERTFIVSQILECHDAASESAITDIAAYVAPYLEDIEPYRRSNELYDTPPTKTVIRYQFRRPNYGEKPVTITGMGVYKSPNGPQRTLSYIRGIMDGKEEEKRFKIDRLAAISDPETGEIIPDILAFFLPHATIRQENSQISDAD